MIASMVVCMLVTSASVGRLGKERSQDHQLDTQSTEQQDSTDEKEFGGGSKSPRTKSGASGQAIATLSASAIQCDRLREAPHLRSSSGQSIATLGARNNSASGLDEATLGARNESTSRQIARLGASASGQVATLGAGSDSASGLYDGTLGVESQ